MKFPSMRLVAMNSIDRSFKARKKIGKDWQNIFKNILRRSMTNANDSTPKILQNYLCQ